MATIVYPGVRGPVGSLATSRSYPAAEGGTSNQRIQTDPFYYAGVVVANIAAGSRWQLGYQEDGVFTEFSPGFEGTVDGVEGTFQSFVIEDVPAFWSPFLLELRVRKASSGVKYKPYKALAYHSQPGTSIYSSQEEDEVA